MERRTHRQVRYAEPGPDIRLSEMRSFRKRYRTLLRRADMVVLAGSVPSRRLSGVYADLIAEAKARRVRVILDTSGEALARGVAADRLPSGDSP